MESAFSNLFDLRAAYSRLSHDQSSQITFIVVFFVFWSLLYTVVNITWNSKSLPTKDSNDIKNRIVSIVHGIGAFWLAAYEYLPYPVYNQPNTNFQIFITIFSLTYCIYDLLACIYYKLADSALISHHLFVILGCAWGVWAGYGAIGGIGGLFVAEISNFYMHLRVILKLYNRKNTKAYEYSENIYFATYILFRGIVCPFFVWYPCVTSFNTPIVIKLMCTAIEVQSLYFIFQMIGIIKKKLKRYQEMKSKSVQFKWIAQNPEQLERLSFYHKKQQAKIF